MQIPAWLLEGSNGATAFAFAFVFIFQLIFLAGAALVIRDAKSFYRQMKPVIALTVMAGGHMLRFAEVWTQRFIENNGFAILWTPRVSVVVHVVGTFAAIIGVLCWLRVTMPQFCGRWVWFLILFVTGLIFVYPMFV